MKYTILVLLKSLQVLVEKSRLTNKKCGQFLGAKAYPNCNEEPTMEEAKQLFTEHCANCHATDLKTNLTGPALFGGPQEYTKMWFTRFTENSQHMIATNDPRALEQWLAWGPTVMNTFVGELTKAEISAIFKYIQSVK